MATDECCQDRTIGYSLKHGFDLYPVPRTMDLRMSFGADGVKASVSILILE